MRWSSRGHGSHPGVVDGKVSFGGTEFFYRSIGAGPPVVMLHGGPGLGHAYLRPAMDTLADRFRVVYVDQRGTGRTLVGDPDQMIVASARLMI